MDWSGDIKIRPYIWPYRLSRRWRFYFVSQRRYNSQHQYYSRVRLMSMHEFYRTDVNFLRERTGKKTDREKRDIWAGKYPSDFPSFIVATDNNAFSLIVSSRLVTSFASDERLQSNIEQSSNRNLCIESQQIVS